METSNNHQYGGACGSRNLYFIISRCEILPMKGFYRSFQSQLKAFFVVVFFPLVLHLNNPLIELYQGIIQTQYVTVYTVIVMVSKGN